METCEDCGFEWEVVERGEIGPRALQGARAIGAALARQPAVAVRRPASDRWSSLEYAAHVRDVLLTIRDRLVIGLVEDDPGFKPMYRDERIDLGLYRGDTPADVIPELESAATMFVRLFDAIEPDQLQRSVLYGYPDPMRRTLLWMGQQAVHEVEHHGTDVMQNHRMLGQR
jgi:hypothetical protein